MAAMCKMGPALGMARVGNHRDEFFIGSERLGQMPTERDKECTN